jgi:hypothetical protein
VCNSTFMLVCMLVFHWSLHLNIDCYSIGHHLRCEFSMHFNAQHAVYDISILLYVLMLCMMHCTSYGSP